MGDKKETLNQTLPVSGTALVSLREQKAGTPAQEPRTTLVIYHRDGVRVVPLLEGESTVIGRSHPADVAIRDNTLARQRVGVELVGGAM